MLSLAVIPSVTIMKNDGRFFVTSLPSSGYLEITDMLHREPTVFFSSALPLIYSKLNNLMLSMFMTFSSLTTQMYIASLWNYSNFFIPFFHITLYIHALFASNNSDLSCFAPKLLFICIRISVLSSSLAVKIHHALFWNYSEVFSLFLRINLYAHAMFISTHSDSSCLFLILLHNSL